jgi:hypothetical protein
MQQAARIALALPIACPEGMDSSDFVEGHEGAARVLAFLAVPLRKVCEPAAASTGASGGATLEGMMRRQELHAAAWEVVDLVPHMAQVLHALWAQGADADALVGLCQNYGAAASLLGDAGSGLGGICSGSELAAWAVAADAGVRLLPLLAQLHADWQRLPAGQAMSRPDAAVGLAELLLHYLAVGSSHLADERVNGGGATQQAAAGSEPQPTPAFLAKQLCRLHKSTCSLVHWLREEGNRALMPDCFDLDLWFQLLEALHSQLRAALDVLDAAGEESEELLDRRCECEWGCCRRHVCSCCAPCCRWSLGGGQWGMCACLPHPCLTQHASLALSFPTQRAAHHSAVRSALACGADRDIRIREPARGRPPRPLH